MIFTDGINIREYEHDNVLKDNPALLIRIRQALKVTNFYFSPLTDTYTLFCSITPDFEEKLSALLDEVIIEKDTAHLIEVCKFPHETKNYICYISGHNLYVLEYWSGKSLLKDSDILSRCGLINCEIEPRNFICLCAQHINLLARYYAVYYRHPIFKSSIIHHEDEESPI